MFKMAMISPKRKPREFGFKQGDTHLVLNAQSKEAKFYSFDGALLYKAPVLCWGQSKDWRVKRGDTPPGLYKLGEHWNDYELVPPNLVPPHTDILRQFGWLTFDMVDLEGNEDGSDRAGVALHGGGSGAGWPGAWAPKQPLFPTYGCPRMHNIDLRDKVLPRYRLGTVFVSVFQEV
jgi:hypothetical protein